ncbi:prolyl endopeptidase [Verrucomicrobia bacterium SCGC AG-212-E04]|nr:prolyl endopeptidase [Verrucomicrobia bacterium SCGC AG-212-E04]
MEVVDDLHGSKVADPYRWLEDANSAETAAWVEKQNEVTFGFLRAIPVREKIRERLTKIFDYERYGIPFKEGGRYFFAKNSGLQNQSPIYTTKALDQTPTLLLDPNTLAADGTVSLSSYSVSPDGKYMAYGVQTSGSDWIEWHVREVETGKDLADKIEWSKFSGSSWTKDSKGFFYSRYDAGDEKTKLQTSNYFQKVYYHQVGTPQSEDVLVYDRKDQKEWGFGAVVSDDGKYLAMRVSQGTSPKNRFFFRELKNNAPSGPVVELLKDGEAMYQFIGNNGPVFFFRTDKDAPRRRLISIDTSKPGDAPKEIVPQSEEALDAADYVGGRFICSYLKDAKTQVRIFDLAGKKLGEVQFPGIGTATGFGGKPEDPETFYSFTGFTRPTTIYRYDVASGANKIVFQPKVDFNPDDYITEQVFYPSKDGTKIPMFITYKKGLKKDGQNATYLYAYGGFSISITPSFSAANLTWLEMGGVYAVANLRGGGEYGEAWHEAGTKKNKQNVFDDFIAAGEWLIANKYTSTPKLAIGGGSNGGLLVGACMTQRPDLYGAALPAVGVMDMLRFQKFTIGWAWTSDYGSADDPEMFAYLRGYSPYHNLKPGTKYPATMVTTSDHDDRVVPAHSFKFAAELQADQAGPAPVLIRIETKSGHGAGRPTAKIIEESADRWAFLWSELGMKPKSTPLP